MTGNPPADLQPQLAAILTFNHIWAQYIPVAGNREAGATAASAACWTQPMAPAPRPGTAVV